MRKPSKPPLWDSSAAPRRSLDAVRKTWGKTSPPFCPPTTTSGPRFGGNENWLRWLVWVTSVYWGDSRVKAPSRRESPHLMSFQTDIPSNWAAMCTNASFVEL
uniref:Uncharacterized protein n=1 Tax=Sphaerodactylus townsendi TaxID=933632 RepID=A0ACB8FK98_9SAUR